LTRVAIRLELPLPLSAISVRAIALIIPIGI
jgi:hypothetical protein